MDVPGVLLGLLYGSCTATLCFRLKASVAKSLFTLTPRLRSTYFAVTRELIESRCSETRIVSLS